MKSEGVDPFMHGAAAIGHANAARSVMLAARQFSEFPRSIGVSIAVVENAVIDAVGMFVHHEPTGTGPRIDQIAGLLGPPKSAAVGKAVKLLAISDGAVHGATADAARPARTALGRGKESAVDWA